MKYTVNVRCYKKTQCNTTNNNPRVAITPRCSQICSLGRTLANSVPYFFYYDLLKMDNTNPPQLSNNLKQPKLWRRQRAPHLKKDHKECGNVSSWVSTNLWKWEHNTPPSLLQSGLRFSICKIQFKEKNDKK